MIPRISGGAAWPASAILPFGAASETRLLLAARGLRAIGDGFVSLLLPVYLLELGHGPSRPGSSLPPLLPALRSSRFSSASMPIAPRGDAC
jgi:hypothetical protein